MKTFDWYFLKNIALAILATLIFLLALDFLVQSSEEIDDIGTGSYSLSIMLYTTALLIPQKIIEFLPAAILVGALMSIGQMNVVNELVIIRASGISRLRIVASGIVLTLILGVGLIAIGEFCAPYFNQKSESIRNQALHRTSATSYQSDIWLKDKDNAMVHVDKLNSDGSISDITFYQKDADDKITIQNVKRAEFKGDHWEFESVTSFNANAQEAGIHNESTRIWHSSITPSLLFSLADSASASTIRELFTLTRFLKANQLNCNSESLRLWQRLLLPLSTLTMLLLAMPFAFSSQRARNAGARLVIGILLGVSYYILQGIFSSFALLLHWPAFLGAILPIMILSAPPLFFLIRE